MMMKSRLPAGDLLAFLSLLVVVGSAASRGAEGPSDAAVDAYLNHCETGYSAEHQMLGMPFQSPIPNTDTTGFGHGCWRNRWTKWHRRIAIGPIFWGLNSRSY
jgi:hypothetical protein